MKAPDFLLVLTVLVALGAAVTGVAADATRATNISIPESSIR
ncbi:MAG: hypothetical protein P1U57_10415 [Oleibacter sp.]|nr:hypothetical protein [Thalassolituus sp.]